MRRSFLLPLFLAASLLAVACSSSRPARPSSSSIEVFREPSIIGAIDQSTQEAAAQAEEGEKVGRRVGRVAGVFAAVFGGGTHDSIEQAVDRYRITRDAATVAGVLIGAVHGAKEGGERGYAFDLQFASVQAIDGLTATRPAPDQIDVELADDVSEQAIRDFASVFDDSTDRVIDIEAFDDAALDMRDALIGLGVPSQINAHRNDALRHIVLHIRPL